MPEHTIAPDFADRTSTQPDNGDVFGPALEHEHTVGSGHVHSVDCGHLHADIHVDSGMGHAHDHETHVHGDGCGHVSFHDAAATVDRSGGSRDHQTHEHSHEHEHGPGCGHVHHREAATYIDAHEHTEHCGHLHHSEADEMVDSHSHEHVHSESCGHLTPEAAAAHIDRTSQHIEARPATDDPAETSERNDRSDPTLTLVTDEAMRAATLTDDTERPTVEPASHALVEDRNQTTLGRDSPKDVPMATELPGHTQETIQDEDAQPDRPVGVLPELDPEDPNTVNSASADESIKKTPEAEAGGEPDEVCSNQLDGLPNDEALKVNPVYDRAGDELTAFGQHAETEPVVEATPGEPEGSARQDGEASSAQFQTEQRFDIPDDGAADMIDLTAPDIFMPTENMPETSVPAALQEKMIADVQTLLQELGLAMDTGQQDLSLQIYTHIANDVMDAGAYLPPEQRLELLRYVGQKNLGAIREMFERLIEQTIAGRHFEDMASATALPMATDDSASAGPIGRIVLFLYKLSQQSALSV